MTQYLEPTQAIAVVEHLGLHNRDRGLLFSALARPAASMFGEGVYQTLELKAAALFSSLAQNDPLFDGNKRLSWILTLAFIRLNDYRVVMAEDAAFELVLRVARSELELEEIGAILAEHMVHASSR